MKQTRVRAFAPELAGAGVAVASLVVLWFLSEAIGNLLQLHVSRRFVTALGAAVVALVALLVLLILVAGAHAHASKTVIGFFVKPVAPSNSAWRRGLIYFSGFELSIAFAFALLGLISL